MWNKIAVVGILAGVLGLGWVMAKNVEWKGAGVLPVVGQQWEYATMVETSSSAVWDDPSREVVAAAPSALESGQLLYQKLGGVKMPLAAVTGSDLLTQIGKDGWELVTITGDREISGYYFKRPRVVGVGF